VRADGSVDSRRSSNDIVSLQRIVPTAVTGGGNIFPNVWNTTDKQRSFPVVNSQEISIIIIIELLRNRKYCEMYRLAWLTYWGRVSVVRQLWVTPPRMGLVGVFRYSSRTEWLLGENSALQTLSKDSPKIMNYSYCLNMIYREASGHTESLYNKCCVKQFREDESN